MSGERVSAYRAWRKHVAEFPSLRRDLEYKLGYFICWELAR
jgi:hypothetical protein